MHDSNQTAGEGAAGPPGPPAAGAYVALDGAPGEAGSEPPPERVEPPEPPSVWRPLLIWLVGLLVFGAGGMLLHEQELALLAAAAGLFVVAQAADVNRGWREVYYALGWVVPALGFMISLAVGVTIWQSELPGLLRGGLLLFSACGAGLAVLIVPTPIANQLARALFRDPAPGHVLRLTARAVALTFALVVPAWFAAQIAMVDLLAVPGSFMDQVGLSGGLIGYLLLAFAGVGWLVRRDFAAAAARLGLAWPGWRDLIAAALVLGVLWGLNVGADALQHRLLPALWESDRHVTESIASGMGFGTALLLGLSAGIGEEITLRGGLQPRLGILLTSAFFAALHVQYSWFGMLVILALGLVLGVTRKRTNTTVAMIAHVAYDVIAVLGQ